MGITTPSRFTFNVLTFISNIHKNAPLPLVIWELFQGLFSWDCSPDSRKVGDWNEKKYCSAKIGLTRAAEDDSAVFEIILGTDNNTVSKILLGFGGAELAFAATPQILSPTESRSC